MLNLSADYPQSSTVTGLNLMPLMDVMMLLLIFFLLASVFARPTLEVDLPAAAHSRSEPERNQQLTISLNREGKIFVNRAPIPLDELSERITEALTRDRNTPVVVRADKACAFAHFVAVMDAVKGAGAAQLIVETTRAVPGEQP
jgi:biopolymer transport protein ExbD